MNLKWVLVGLFFAATPVWASWTCAGQCGYLTGQTTLHSVVPAALIFGTGNLPQDAYENAVSKCGPVVPEKTKAMLVRGFVNYPDKAELLIISTACVKN